MDLKVQINAEGKGYVALVDPATGDHKKAGDVDPGQELVVNLSTVTSADQVTFGPPTETGTEPADAPAEGEQAPPADGAPEGGEQPAQGDGGTPEGAPAEGEGEQVTTAESERALYLVDGDTIPEGFQPSGLETLEGRTLYHFAGDVAGGESTGNADGVSIFAEAAETGTVVQKATDTPSE